MSAVAKFSADALQQSSKYVVRRSITQGGAGSLLTMTESTAVDFFYFHILGLIFILIFVYEVRI